MDLNAPLGLNPASKARTRTVVPIAIGAIFAAALTTGLGVYLYQADPHGGEPYAVALVPPPPPKSPTEPRQGSSDPTPTGSIGAVAAADAVRMENGVKVVSPTSPGSSKPRESGPIVIDVSKALDERARKATGRDSGSRTAALPTLTTGQPKPRVAIVVGALGLSDTATRTAIETMPAAVSFAFVPYGAGLSASLDAARSKGHEILLQLPMQDLKGTMSTPHALRTGETASDMTQDLNWLTGRFDGYVGVANLLGAPVTANQQAMTTILKAVGQRGVFYLDDGTSKRSIAVSLGTNLGVPTAQADVVLDATADPAVVQANLERLAAIARAKGSAIGMASGLSDHLAAVARFAAALDARGLALVPVSTVARSGGSFATAR